jgi:hypothetical protein
VARVCRAEHANLRAEPRPDAEQVNQLLFGERFEMLEEEGGWALGRAARDGYVGYVESAALAAPWGEPTHWVRALRTYAFPGADLKSAPARLLPMNALVRVTARSGRYLHADGAGWITDSHLAELTSVELDPAGVAERYLEAPYLWVGATASASTARASCRRPSTPAACHARATATCRSPSARPSKRASCGATT